MLHIVFENTTMKIASQKTLFDFYMNSARNDRRFGDFRYSRPYFYLSLKNHLTRFSMSNCTQWR